MSLPPAYDTIKELGVYDQLPSDVKSQMVSLASLPPSVQKKAQEAMTAEVSKDETTDKLMAEVTALGDSVVKVDEAFERVKIGLGKVDANNYKDKNGKPVAKFQPTWIGFQKVCYGFYNSDLSISDYVLRNGPTFCGAPATLLQPLRPISMVSSLITIYCLAKSEHRLCSNYRS